MRPPPAPGTHTHAHRCARRAHSALSSRGTQSASQEAPGTGRPSHRPRSDSQDSGQEAGQMRVPPSQNGHLLVTHTSQEPRFPKTAQRAAAGRPSSSVGTGSEARQPSRPGPPRTRALALARSSRERAGADPVLADRPWAWRHRRPRAPWGQHPCPSLRATHSKGPSQATRGHTKELPGSWP